MHRSYRILATAFFLIAVPAMRKKAVARIRYDLCMKTWPLVAALSFAGVHCTMPPPPSNIPNNLVFSGGTVVSGSTQTPHANYAVAVADGKVVAVGPNAEILRTFS